jgi:hypothetical protein
MKKHVHHRRKDLSKFLYGIFLVLLFFTTSNAQDLPDKIRGYKVHKTKISIKTHDEKSEKTNEDQEAFVKISEPELIDIGLTGVRFELNAELDSIEQSGKVDFLTFKDFRVNGLAVEVEEYKESFTFKKNEPINLPKPFNIFVSTGQTLIGAAKELGKSKGEWRVTGRVFVFGRFKKSIFTFKRVVPVDIDINIKNPLLK